MLLFRSEEHVERWTRQWHLTRGALLPLQQGWALARAWFTDRREPAWRRRTTEETESLLGSLGLTGSFWRLRAP